MLSFIVDLPGDPAPGIHVGQSNAGHDRNNLTQTYPDQTGCCGVYCGARPFSNEIGMAQILAE
jgi:hypothetical protein